MDRFAFHNIKLVYESPECRVKGDFADLSPFCACFFRINLE